MPKEPPQYWRNTVCRPVPDFESVQFAVPIWQGTRPYQQNVFQFSLHTLGQNGQLEHACDLDLSGDDPSEGLAKALVAACGTHGPVYVYNRNFESGRIHDLAQRFPALGAPLLAISERLVDLLPIAREHFYHPSQQGSWSLKRVLPAVVPELRYDTLDGVQDGGMAMEAYLEAIHPDIPLKRQLDIAGTGTQTGTASSTPTPRCACGSCLRAAPICNFSRRKAWQYAQTP